MGYLAFFFQRRNTILVIQTGAVVLLLSSILTWIRVSDSGNVVELSGADMAPVVRVIGVIGVVMGMLVTIARRWVRGLSGAVLLGGGVIALMAAILALSNPASAAAPALAGLGISAEDFGSSFGLWVALAGSLALVTGALAVLLFSPGWEDESSEGSRG